MKTKEQIKYQQIYKKLLKVRQELKDALKNMQNSCKHENVACRYEHNDFDDYFEYRICCDCGYHEQDKNELCGFTLKSSNKIVCIDEYYELMKREI